MIKPKGFSNWLFVKRRRRTEMAEVVGLID